MNKYDLFGVGIGPFNLSVAALFEKIKDKKALFCDAKEFYSWHSEILFDDATMQTSFLKDLVTSVDPTNPYSFLNYLVTEGLFHSFMNTSRTGLKRREFELYCRWAAEKMEDRCQFSTEIHEISFKDQNFLIKTNRGKYQASNLCLASGPVPKVPECTERFLGKDVFHAKSVHLSKANFKEKNIVIVGGGQTGIEIFRNTLNGQFGEFKSLKLMTARNNLEPLENSPFINEYFTPQYVDLFYHADASVKKSLLNEQKMASDGNTPEYLDLLYNDLYQFKFIQQDSRLVAIHPCHLLQEIDKKPVGLELQFWNSFHLQTELHQADIVILATGFETKVPRYLEPMLGQIELIEDGAFKLNPDFSLNWEHDQSHKIFALNFSRQGHGIAEPQLSLMAWRAAVILNEFCGEDLYPLRSYRPLLVDFGEKRHG